eukprot:GFKZ01010676.1.p1 GENE.GFKZ01010676.1~~GFKZ01010676.1.p1  ORF type:complete len:269 (-),score=49.38 GFKZ01010676.1:2331-3137(-)
MSASQSAHIRQLSRPFIAPLRSLAGHSHYHNTRHRKAAVDAARQSTLTRLAREMRTALRMGVGGGDSRANARLARAIDNARRAGMPKERIARIVDAHPKDGAANQTALFEGVLRSGGGFLVRASTERRNRVTAELRAMFVRAGRELGRAAWMFEDRFAVVVRAQEEYLLDDVMWFAIENGAFDIVESEDGTVELLCEDAKGRESLRGRLMDEFPKLSEEHVYGLREFRPKSVVQVGEDHEEKVQRLLQRLDEHPDVVEVIHNLQLSAD